MIWVVRGGSGALGGLEKALAKEFRVHFAQELPEGKVPCCVVIRAGGEEDLSQVIRRVRGSCRGVPVLVFGADADLRLARAALKAGARGFVHGGMTSDQALRAFEVALEGEIVAPRGLLEYVLIGEERANLDLLSSRQREILWCVADGMSNAQIARRVFLSESTVKQYLCAAYKLLGVGNRAEAARIFRNSA